MKGTNMLKVNQETLVEALQDYLSQQMAGHLVRSVNLPGNGYFGAEAGQVLAEVVVVFEGVAPPSLPTELMVNVEEFRKP